MVKTAKLGLPLSLAAHVVAVGGGFYYSTNYAAPPPAPQIVPVRLVPAGEIASISKKRTPPSPKDPTPAATAPVPNTAPNKSDIKPPATEDTRQPPPRFDLNALEAMITEPGTETLPAPAPDAPDYPASNLSGNDLRDSVKIIDYISVKMQPCWYIDTGMEDYQNLRVEVRLTLKPDGAIDHIRILNNAQILASENKSWRSARENVVAGLHKCAPYTGLTGVNYDLWSVTQLNFQPGAE